MFTSFTIFFFRVRVELPNFSLDQRWTYKGRIVIARVSTDLVLKQSHDVSYCVLKYFARATACLDIVHELFAIVHDVRGSWDQGDSPSLLIERYHARIDCRCIHKCAVIQRLLRHLDCVYRLIHRPLWVYMRLERRNQWLAALMVDSCLLWLLTTRSR